MRGFHVGSLLRSTKSARISRARASLINAKNLRGTIVLISVSIVRSLDLLASGTLTISYILAMYTHTYIVEYNNY